MDNILDSSLTIIIAIAVPIIAAIIPLIYEEVKERKGNRVLVHLVSVTPQFSISNSIKKNLTVSFKGKTVGNVIAHTFKIGNQGRKIVEPFDLSMIFIPEDEKEKIEFIECQIADLMLDAEAEGFVFDSGKHGIVKLWRNFLNPYKIYKEEIIELVVLANTKLLFNIYGGDKNWVLDSRSRYPRNLDMLIRANRFSTISWIYCGISVLALIAGLFTNNSALSIVGGIGIGIYAIFSGFQTVVMVLDTKNMIKETKNRVKRVKQTYNDSEVLREVDEFVARVKFMKRNGIGMPNKSAKAKHLPKNAS